MGAPAGSTQLLGSSGNLVNFKGIDSIGTSQYQTFPVSAGSNSYEVWLRGFFSGVFNAIWDLRFWMNTDFSPNTGLTVKAKTNGQTTYLQPSNLTSSVAVSNVSTSNPGTANLSIGGSLSSSLLATGYSDFVVLQLQTDVSAPAGDTSLAVFVFSYLED